MEQQEYLRRNSNMRFLLGLALFASVVLGFNYMAWWDTAKRVLGGAVGQAAQLFTSPQARQRAGQEVAGYGQALSNILGTQVRAAPGGASLGAKLAGAGKEFYNLPGGRTATETISPIPLSSSQIYISPETRAARAGFEQTKAEQRYPQTLQNVLGAGTGDYYNAPAEDPRQAAENTLQDIVNQLAAEFTPYLDRIGADPFAFDEALAEKIRDSTLRLTNPYYYENFQNFLRGTRAQAGAGEAKLKNILQELGGGTEFFQGRSRRLLESALEQARQGFAERGLLFSGERGREEGLLKVQREQELQNFLRGQQRQEQSARQTQRNLIEQLALDKEQKEREIAQSQAEDVATAIEKARQRAMAGAEVIESYGPAPGQSYQDWLGQREKTFKSFTYGPAVS